MESGRAGSALVLAQCCWDLGYVVMHIAHASPFLCHVMLCCYSARPTYSDVRASPTGHCDCFFGGLCHVPLHRAILLWPPCMAYACAKGTSAHPVHDNLSARVLSLPASSSGLCPHGNDTDPPLGPHGCCKSSPDPQDWQRSTYQKAHWCQLDSTWFHLLPRPRLHWGLALPPAHPLHCTL